MRRNPALIDLHLFLAKNKAAQTKISSESSLVNTIPDKDKRVDTSTSQQ